MREAVRLQLASRTVTAFEHQPLAIAPRPSAAAVTDEECDLLSRLGELRPGFCDRGYSSIRLAQYCGLISLGHRVLEVLPKIEDSSDASAGRGLLLRLLRAADDVPVFLHQATGHQTQSAPLLDIFISAFLDEVTTLVRAGLPRRYREVNDDLGVLRGRLASQRQFTSHFNRLDRIACEFDDLTHDSQWNRLIKAGLRVVRDWISSESMHRRWVELVIAFEDVVDVRCSPRDIDRLVFDRQASRYRAAMGWVRLLLSLLSPDTRAGESAAPGLLVDANKLFERAVSRRMHRRASRSAVLSLAAHESERYLASEKQNSAVRFAKLIPDLVISRNGHVAAIGDTKWKRVDVDGRTKHLIPSSADLYQMQAYASAYQCEELALIYPWHSGLAGSKPTSLSLPPLGSLRPVVHMLCVDVQNDEFPLRSNGGSEMVAALIEDGVE